MAMSRLIVNIQEWTGDAYQTLLRLTPEAVQQVPGRVILAIVSGSLGAVLLWRSWRNRHKRLPPSPRGWPLIGSMLDISDDKMHLDFLRLQKRDNLPDIYTLNIGSYRMIILNSYEVIKETFLKDGDTYGPRAESVLIEAIGLKDEFGTKDFNDPTWKDSKNFILSALRAAGFNMAKSVDDKVAAQVQALEEYLEPYIKDGKPIEFRDVLPQVAANVIGDIIHSKMYSLTDPELKSNIETLREFYATMLSVFYVEFLPLWLGRLLYRMTAEKKMNRLFEDLLTPIRNSIKSHQETLDHDNLRDFIDIYLSKKQGPIDLELLTHTAFAFYPDAVDTMERIMEWVLLYVAVKPDIQERIQKEIDRVVGDGQSVTYSDRPNLAYTEAVITEVMRVASIVWMTGPHTVTKDTYFRGYFIPRGVPIIANLYAALNDPIFFKDPQEFRPERFLDESGKFRHIEAWIPFSVGRRKCVGETIVKMEVFMLVSRLLQRYSLRLPDGVDPPPLVPAGVNELVPRYSVVLKARLY